MSADPLVDTYARYKKGTSRLIEWLCESAKECGIKIQPSTNGKTKVPTATLLTYTTRIVQNIQPKIDIPLAIVHVAQDVIAGRKLCYRFDMTFASQDDAGNKRHKHFINTLEKMHDDLRREYKSRLPKRKKHIPAASDNDNDFANIFSHLELKDTSSSDGVPANSQSQASSVRGQTKKNEVKEPKADSRPSDVKYEFGDEDEEVRFAVWCLLEDFDQTRTHLQKLWRKYADGEISLMTATKVTNHAFSLMKSLCNKFNTAHEEYDSYVAIIDLIGIDTHMEALRDGQANGETGEEALSRAESLAEPSKDDTKATGLLCIEAWQTLHDFQQLQWSVLMSEHDDFKDKRPHMIKPPPLFGLHLYEISTAIFSLMATKAPNGSCRRIKDMVNKWQDINDVVDPYTEMLCDVTKADNFLDAASVHMTQICFDISDILDGHLDRAVQESIEAIERVRSTCEEAILVYEQKTAANNDYFWNMAPNFVVDKLRGIRDMVKLKQYQDGKEGWTMRASDCPDTVTGMFIPLDIIRAIPFLPMHVAHIALQQLVFDGVQYCNCNLLTLSAAHLQKATSLFGCPQEPWPDMELFLSHQSANLLRQGDESMSSTARQFSLALGVPLLTLTSSKNTRPRLPSMQQCLQRAAMAQRRDTIRESCNAVKESRGHPIAIDVLYEAVRRHAADSGIHDPIIAAQFEFTKKLSTTQILEVLLDIVAKEEKYLNFDYWSFANRCATWLSNVATLYDSETKEAKFIGIWGTVHNILWDAAKTEEKDEPRKPTVLYRAGMELSHMLKSKDCLRGSLSSAALSLSSGTLAQYRKPNTRYAGSPRAEIPKVKRIVDVTHTASQCAFTQIKAWELSKLSKSMLKFGDWRAKGQNQGLSEEMARAGYRNYVCNLLLSFAQELAREDFIESMIARKEWESGRDIRPSTVLLSTALHWH